MYNLSRYFEIFPQFDVLTAIIDWCISKVIKGFEFVCYIGLLISFIILIKVRLKI